MENEEAKEKSAFGSWQDPGEADEGDAFASKGSRQGKKMQEGRERELEKNRGASKKEYFDIALKGLQQTPNNVVKNRPAQRGLGQKGGVVLYKQFGLHFHPLQCV